MTAAPVLPATDHESSGLQVTPDPEAVEFAASVRAMLEQHAGRDALRGAWDSPTGRIPGLWERLADAGATGLVVPEEYGGIGLDLTAALPLLVEAGRAALPEPLAATLAGAALLARAGGTAAARWLPAIVEGSTTVGLAGGPEAIALGGAWADLLIVRPASGGAVLAVPAAETACRPLETVDPGAGLAQMSLATAREANAEEALPGITADAALDVACACVAAELLGLAEALLAMSTDYAKTRRQFGQPIGAFQAIKHHLADVFVAVSFARPVVTRATWSVVQQTPTASREASHAMYAAGTAARLAARTALQVHGGIGYTYEHDLHMWHKRVWTLTSVLGDPARHRRRVALLLASGSGAAPA